MCRLFGFRSVINSQVHESLVHAENALGTQSSNHPDGWGVSYYVAGSPHIIKSERTAINDNIFKKVSGVVSSQTVLAHIRKATLGEINILNTHPFQYGRWTFAHNGNIKDFSKVRDKLRARISPEFRRFILGTTDSEILFYYLLSNISNHIDLNDKSTRVGIVMEALNESINEIIKLIGPLHLDSDGPNTETYLTFILTNGDTMIGFNGGKRLCYSTYKKKCQDRDTCPSFSPECEAPAQSGFINHLIFSSEPLSGDNEWVEMSPYQMIGVDCHMEMVSIDFSVDK